MKTKITKIKWKGEFVKNENIKSFCQKKINSHFRFTKLGFSSASQESKSTNYAKISSYIYVAP